MDNHRITSTKVYTAGSLILIFVAVHYAITVTNNDKWHQNESKSLLKMASGFLDQPSDSELSLTTPMLDEHTSERQTLDKAVDVLVFIFQDPLCLCLLVNAWWCCLLGTARSVLGRVRPEEAHAARLSAVGYALHRVPLALSSAHPLPWLLCYFYLGSLYVFTRVLKHRIDHSASEEWQEARRAGAAAACSAAGAIPPLLVTAVLVHRATNADSVFNLMLLLPECALVWCRAAHAAASGELRARRLASDLPVHYYTVLTLECGALVCECVCAGGAVCVARGCAGAAAAARLLDAARDLRARFRAHRARSKLADDLYTCYPVCSEAELEGAVCAICWEPMAEARRLPCRHYFHSACLCVWVRREASCPACRRPLLAAVRAARDSHAEHELRAATDDDFADADAPQATDEIGEAWVPLRDDEETLPRRDLPENMTPRDVFEAGSEAREASLRARRAALVRRARAAYLQAHPDT